MSAFFNGIPRVGGDFTSGNSVDLWDADADADGDGDEDGDEDGDGDTISLPTAEMTGSSVLRLLNSDGEVVGTTLGFLMLISGAGLVVVLMTGLILLHNRGLEIFSRTPVLICSSYPMHFSPSLEMRYHKQSLSTHDSQSFNLWQA